MHYFYGATPKINPLTCQTGFWQSHAFVGLRRARRPAVNLQNKKDFSLLNFPDCHYTE
jgi:hypothetical protein